MTARLFRLGIKRLISEQASTFLGPQLLIYEALGFTYLPLEVVLAAQKEDSSIALGRHLVINGHGHRSSLITSINHALDLLLQGCVFLAELRIGKALGKIIDRRQGLVELHHTTPQLCLVFRGGLIL